MTRTEAEELAWDAIHRGVYAKNIRYGFTPDADVRELDLVVRFGGTPGQAAWTVQQAYRKCGAQMQVQQEVSDDLIESDFSAASQLTDIPWPAKVVEVFFEDPLLPTILLMKIAPGDLENWFPQLTEVGPQDEYMMALMQEGTDDDSKFLSLQLKPSLYEQFMQESAVGQNMVFGVLNSALDPQDNATLNFMMRLAMKVFAFASMPHLKPQPITRKQMHFGGKPDVKGRPQRPAFRALYLPNVRYQFAGETSRSDPGSSEKREFLGRRGHFRFLRSEFFKRMQGQWTIVRPAPGPDGLLPSQRARVLKVRKPG